MSVFPVPLEASAPTASVASGSPRFLRRLCVARWRSPVSRFSAQSRRLRSSRLIVLPEVADENAGDLLGVRQGPSWEHLLGTDTLGRDVLDRLLVGTRVTLIGVAEALLLRLRSVSRSGWRQATSVAARPRGRLACGSGVLDAGDHHHFGCPLGIPEEHDGGDDHVRRARGPGSHARRAVGGAAGPRGALCRCCAGIRFVAPVHHQSARTAKDRRTVIVQASLIAAPRSWYRPGWRFWASSWPSRRRAGAGWSPMA